MLVMNHYEGSDFPIAPTHTGKCAVCGEQWPCRGYREKNMTQQFTDPDGDGLENTPDVEADLDKIPVPTEGPEINPEDFEDDEADDEDDDAPDDADDDEDDDSDTPEDPGADEAEDEKEEEALDNESSDDDDDDEDEATHDVTCPNCQHRFEITI